MTFIGISADDIGKNAEYQLTDIADMIFRAAETADIRQQPKIGRTLVHSTDARAFQD